MLTEVCLRCAKRQTRHRQPFSDLQGTLPVVSATVARLLDSYSQLA